MRALYKTGYDMTAKGFPWAHTPPGYEEAYRAATAEEGAPPPPPAGPAPAGAEAPAPRQPVGR